MTTELFIEKYRLDISKDLSALITFELDNIKNFAARSTTWSKTIVLPGTANNNKLFGHIFQIGQGNFFDASQDNVGYNFNASKSADCIIFQDQMQTFRGVLRLLQINVIEGKTEYEVAVFGKLASLNVSLGGRFLDELDFSAYDHLYNETNIVASWDNVPGSGYYYPLIDYGTYSTLKHDWDIRTFRPALYVREYIDKMFTAAGFRWSSDLFDTDRFKKLVIPHNQKKLLSRNTSVEDADTSSSRTVINTTLGMPNSTAIWDTHIGGGFTYANIITGGQFTYNQPDTLTAALSWRLTGTRTTSAIPGTFTVSIRKNGVALASQVFNTAPFFTTPWVWASSVNTTISTNDVIDVYFTYNGIGTDMVVTLDSASQFNVDSVSPVLLPLDPGGTVTINDSIPKNIRQIDFLVSIVKLFNLYIWEDKFDTSLIYIKPYIDYYTNDSSDAIDWTYKLDRSKNIAIKPMSELNARKYEFKYKPDSDFWNDLYRKRYNEGYGDYVFDSQYEFAEQTNSLEILFSATPLIGYDGEDKIYSTIFKRTGPDTAPVEENTDSNIRILQTLKVVGVTSWDIKDGATVLTSLNNYGYAGHLDDPDVPSNDLNFGVLRELFFILLTGDLTVTQFNVYWSGYMAEITDKDSKLVTCSIYLNAKDILLLDFSKKIFIDGVLFRLNSIQDYNVSSPAVCKVELLKINYLAYSGEVPAPEENFLLWSDEGFLLDIDMGKIKYN